jgi:hypothetical protein
MKSQFDYARAFNKWKRDFAAAAKADNYAEFQRTIEHLGLDCTPKGMMRNTILLVSTSIIYRQMDGIKCESFLEQQHYNSTWEGKNEYRLTFDLGDGMFGRLMGDQRLYYVDLADLFGHCWMEIERAGFDSVYITRLDGRTINKVELKRLDELVRDDFYFDYGRDEVQVSVCRLNIKDTVEVSATEDFF